MLDSTRGSGGCGRPEPWTRPAARGMVELGSAACCPGQVLSAHPLCCPRAPYLPLREEKGGSSERESLRLGAPLRSCCPLLPRAGRGTSLGRSAGERPAGCFSSSERLRRRREPRCGCGALRCLRIVRWRLWAPRVAGERGACEGERGDGCDRRATLERARTPPLERRYTLTRILVTASVAAIAALAFAGAALAGYPWGP